jgi:hypothetical protein
MTKIRITAGPHRGAITNEWSIADRSIVAVVDGETLALPLAHMQHLLDVSFSNVPLGIGDLVRYGEDWWMVEDAEGDTPERCVLWLQHTDCSRAVSIQGALITDHRVKP